MSGPYLRHHENWQIPSKKPQTHCEDELTCTHGDWGLHVDEHECRSPWKKEREELIKIAVTVRRSLKGSDAVKRAQPIAIRPHFLT